MFLQVPTGGVKAGLGPHVGELAGHTGPLTGGSVLG